MRKIFNGLILILSVIFTFAGYGYCAQTPNVINHRLFSLTLPDSVSNTYSVIVDKRGIRIYDTYSKEAGFGGYAFGIALYRKPSDHAMMPGGRKIGELVKGHSLYDVVLSQPTDVQFDYVNNKSDTYFPLYNLAENPDSMIKGNNGSKYCSGQGMKGEELYGDILKKHLKAINEKWDSKKLEKNNMSYMYNVLASSGENVADKIGYVFYDLNGDGVQELLIGEIAEGEYKGIIYDIYTMVNRKPKHVVSGGSRNRYFATDDVFLCNEYSSGAGESGWRIYVLVENSTQLYPQVNFKCDSYTNKYTPWFISYGTSDEDWENVSEKTFNSRKAVFDKYIRFDFIPFATLEDNK